PMSVLQAVFYHRWPLAITLFLITLSCITMNVAGSEALAPVDESNPKTLWLYVGTYTNGKTPSEGIYLLELDLATGKLASKGGVAKLADPSFLAIHPSRKFLYAVNEVDNLNGKKGGGVSALAIDAGS